MSSPSEISLIHAMNQEDHSTTLPTASDTREQIVANALVLYPDVVQEHINKFPNIPVRATDIFDVCVVDVTKQYGGIGDPKSIAKLTHSHEKHPAARMFLMSGGATATMNGALHSLLEHSVGRLGVSHENVLPEREGCIRQDNGWAFHVDTTRKGHFYAEEVRKLATGSSMAK